MDLLQGLHLEGGLPQGPDRIARGARTLEGRDARHPALERPGPDRPLVEHRRAAERRVDHEIALSLPDPVGDVGMSLVHLEYHPAGNPALMEPGGRAPRGDQVEAHPGKGGGDLLQSRLVSLVHAEEDGPLEREVQSRRHAGLGECGAEAVSDPEHLAGRAHLGTKDRVVVGKAAEWKDGHLDERARRTRFEGQTEAPHRGAQHKARGEPRQGEPDRSAHEGDRSRGARVRLQHVDTLPGYRELDIQEADHAERDPELPRRLPDARQQLGSDPVGRQHGGRIARMNPRHLDVLLNPRDPDRRAVAQGVDVDLGRRLEEPVEEQRMLRVDPDGLVEVGA